MPRRFALYAAYGLLLAASLGLAAREPVMFQKLNTIRPTDRIPDLPVRAGGVIDIAAVIGAIPLSGAPAWNVDPETRHRQTILEGGGNCSQMVFGLAYDLNRQGLDYQIIHMFTVKGLGTGDGHTVLRIPMRLGGENRVGVVDVSFGGVLSGADGPIDALDLEQAPIEGWGSVPLNEKARFPNYHDDFLVEGTLIGYMPPSEVRRYYAFLERVYFPFGSDMQEKYLFDGLALLLGFLPEFYVPRYDEALVLRRGRVVAHRSALWALRSGLVLIPLILGIEALRVRRPS